MWKAERDKERANTVGPESEASSGTDCTPGSSVRKKGLCGVQPGLLDELDEHIVAPEMEAGSSPPGHNDAGSAAQKQTSLRK